MQDSRTIAAKELRLHVVPAIADVPAAAWDACANPATACPDAAGVPPGPEEACYNPFISHAFLHALEASKSATARAGWQPQHAHL